MNLKKLLIYILIFIVSLPVFIWLETSFKINSIFDLIRPLIFSVSLVISLRNIFRKFILAISLIFLGLMIIAYLFWQITLANWIGSLGFGILILVCITYISELLKKGSVNKL